MHCKLRSEAPALPPISGRAKYHRRIAGKTNYEWDCSHSKPRPAQSIGKQVKDSSRKRPPATYNTYESRRKIQSRYQAKSLRSDTESNAPRSENRHLGIAIVFFEVLSYTISVETIDNLLVVFCSVLAIVLRIGFFRVETGLTHRPAGDRFLRSMYPERLGTVCCHLSTGSDIALGRSTPVGFGVRHPAAERRSPAFAARIRRGIQPASRLDKSGSCIFFREPQHPRFSRFPE